jgi:phosphoglycerate dehydrogenase-like enzyme
MKKIGLYGVFSPDVKALFRRLLPDDYEVVEFNSAEEYDKLTDVTCIVNRSYPVPDSLFLHTPKLSLVQKWGAGYDKIDVKAAGARGISVAVCVGGNSTPVAELAVLLILAVYRNLLPLNQKLRQGEWARDYYATRAYMLNGKTVGLLGLGGIGRKTGRIVKHGFDAIVRYYDVVRMPEEKEEALGFQYVDLETLLSTSDIVSLHLPLTDGTRNLINRKTLAMMKSSAVLINTSRGGIIDEAALLEALQTGIIAGAGLDTFASETPGATSPLFALENVVATPHCGGNTADNDINMVKCCIDNILQFEREGALHPPALVNREYFPSSAMHTQ